MNFYVDTSALLKLYVDEAGSDLVWGLLEGAQPVTCRISWVEAHAAIARREREATGEAPTWAVARERLASDWPLLHIVDVSQPLVERAAELAAAFSLRGYDAVQLAAGDMAHGTLAEALTFVCFDRKLNRAARILGMELPEGVPG